MPPMRSSGRKTIATTMIPMPPNHCSIERHSSSPRGMVSRLVNTVEPVVVRPDIASNMASVKSACEAPSMNGTAPASGSTIHTPEAIRKVCWRVRRSFTPLAQASAISAPLMPLTMADSRNTGQWPLRASRSTVIGTSMVRPRAATSRPVT